MNGLDAAEQAIAMLRRIGAAYVPQVLKQPALDELVAVGSKVTFRRCDENVGLVRQRAQIAILDQSTLHAIPALSQLAIELRAWMISPAWHGVGGNDFAPNEVTLMAYPDGDSGISPHRDERRFGLLVAVFSLLGRGWLEITADREGRQILATFACAPGDLVLLRAPGFDGQADGRPLHRVRTADGGRLSLTLRMLTTTTFCPAT